MPAPDAGPSVPVAPAAVLDDPRVAPEYLRLLSVDGTRILLVGVVHDHPASVARAERVVRGLDPSTVAVELPPLALPLFQQGGDDEMSTALSATDGNHAAIDTLGPTFLRALSEEVVDRSPDHGTLRRIGANALSVARNALACRLAARFGTERLPAPSADGTDYDVDPAVGPRGQADHEQRHLERSFSVLRALERPVADEIVDAARERAMARSLGRCPDGSVVAVVGFEHLDGIATALAESGATRLSVSAATLGRFSG